jgi:hypothetical protein
MRESHNLRVVRGTIVAKDALTCPEIGIGVTDADGIAQLGRDDFLQIEEGFIPEEDPASDETVMIVRGQAGERLLRVADQGVPDEAALE